MIKESKTASAQWIQYGTKVVLLAVTYALVGKLGLLLAQGHPGTTPVWPPSGISVAALLIFGYRAWPGVFLGALAFGLATPCSVTLALGVAAGNTMESLAGAWLATRFARGRWFFERPADVLKFAVLVGILSPLVSPPLGATNLSLRHAIFWSGSGSDWLACWLGDLVSLVVLTPLLVIWSARQRFPQSRWQVFEFTLLIGLLILVGEAVFGQLAPATAQGYLLPYLCLPFLLWAAFRFGQRGTTLVVLVLGVLALGGTLRGYGLFARAMPEKALLANQGFIAFNSVMALAVAAVVAQRRKAVAELQRAHDELESRVHRRTDDLEAEVVERRKQEEELRRLNRTLKALSHSNQAMMHAQNEASYLAEVCNIITVDCSHAMVWIGYAEDDEARTVRPVAHAGFEEGYLQTLQVTWADSARGRGPTGTAIRTGKPDGCRNMLADPRFAPWREEAKKRGYHSSVVVPLQTAGKPFGAITIYSRLPETFSEHEIKLLSELGDDLAQGITALRLRSAHAQAETALRRSEERYRGLVEMSPDAVFVNRNNCIVYANPAALQLFGARTPEQILGKSPFEIFHPDSHALVRERIGRVLTGEPQAPIEERIVRVDGMVLEAEVAASSFLDSEGQAIQVILRDVTERKQIQAALRRVNQELERRVAERTAELRSAFHYARGLLEASLDPLVTISPDGTITDVNQGTELVTGVVRAQLIGSDFAIYFTEPGRAESGYQRVLAEGFVRDYPLTIRHVSGRLTEVLYHATVYRDESGKVQGVFAAARDITERKAAEERREITHALLELFAHKASGKEYFESVVAVIRAWIGCQCLGIRVVDQNGEIPYSAAAGFDDAFLKLESRLSITQHRCFCMRAISQQPEAQEGALLTPGGSVHCSDAPGFIGQLTPEQRSHYRGTCVKWGFASIAVIPIRYRDQILGAIHLADRRPGRFQAGTVEFLESMTPLIGEAIQRFHAESEVARYRDHLEELVKQRTSELQAANAQLQTAEANLQRERDELELRVQERTADLSKVNRALQAEIVHRQQAEQERKALQRRLAEAQESERGRIARELHDQLGQELTALKLGLRLVKNQAPASPEVRHSIGQLELLANGLMQEIHRLAWELHPAALDDLGLEAALRRYTATWSEKSGVRVDLHCGGLETGRLPLDLETALYRVTQEALTNISRYAAARRVSVLLERRPGQCSLIIEDDGAGFDSAHVFQAASALGKLGLLGMKERITLAGGTLDLESAPGAGTTVFVRVPLNCEMPAASEPP